MPSARSVAVCALSSARRLSRGPVHLHLDAAGDHREQVVEVVRDPGDECAQRLALLRLEQALPQAQVFGDVP